LVKLLILLLMVLAQTASASYITMNTSVTTKVEKNVLTVMVSSINKGDESAFNVQAEFWLGAKKVLAKKVHELQLDSTYKIVQTFPLKLKTPGHYPLVVTMHYTDANQYPFSALNCQTFAYKSEALPADLFGRMGSAKFWEQGSLNLSLKNRSEALIKAQLTFATPKELSIVKAAKELIVPARGKQQAHVSLENFSALSGSTYQVFALIEFDQDGRHQTIITPGTAVIVERKAVLGIDYIYLLVFLIILILLFAVYQIFKK